MALMRFGMFELDSATGELMRQGRRVHLTPQSAKVLSLLAGRPGEIVTRDELTRHLWGDGTFVDFERSLNFCVASVRSALRDSARAPRFIETVPRRGYRFIAEVAAIQTGVAPPKPESAWVVRWAVAVSLLGLVILRPTAAVHSRETARPEARAAFNEALEASQQGAAERRRSIASLRRAIELDPRFAEAHFVLAHTYLDLALRRELPVTPALTEAELAARRAIALEDAPEARQVLGTVRLLSEWDWTAAERELSRSVALAPDWGLGLSAYARVLSAEGDDKGAIAAVDRAEAVNPTCDLILFDAGAIYARAGRYDEAVRKFRNAIDFGPPKSMSRGSWRAEVEFRIMRVALARGDWVAAHQAASAVLLAKGYPVEVRRRFDTGEPRNAVKAFLRRSLEIVRPAAPDFYGAPTRMAVLHALLGEDEAAVEWLEQAAAERDPELAYGWRDPDFDRLRALPRYGELVRRIRVGHAAAVAPERVR